jgi:peptide/nickel transport system substrate-binding protein
MNSRRRIFIVLLAIILLFPISGVTTVTSQESEMLFVMAYGSDLGELNPLFARSERSLWYEMLVYDTLLSYDDDLNLIPWLAESWAVSPDGLTVNFTIRDGVVWHDGEPLTANDVKFTFEYIKNGPIDINGWSFFRNLTSVVTDGNVVSCAFDKLNSFSLNGLGGIYILPEHIRSGIDADHMTWNDHRNVTSHIGSGPFMYVERVPDEYTELVRNDDWWGPNSPYVGQLPNIERIRIDVIVGQDARILAMISGEADTERYEVFGAYVEEVLGQPELQLVQGVASQWHYTWGFNVTIPGLNDTNVRRALSMAVNRTELINIGRLGHGTRTDSVIPEVFYPSLYSSDSNFPDGDIAGANQLLNDAGYIDLDGDGTRNFPGDSETELEFDLLTLSWDDISVSTGSGLVTQMARINVTLNNLPRDDTLYYDVYDGSYEMFTLGGSLPPVPDYPWWNVHSVNIHSWGSNVYGFNNVTVDFIADDYVASTPTELTSSARNIAVAIMHNVPYVPLYLSDDTHAMRKEWVNYTTPAGGPFASYNPRTMVFMYDNSPAPTTPTTSPTSTTPTDGDQFLVVILGVGGALVVAAVIVVLLRRR